MQKAGCFFDGLRTAGVQLSARGGGAVAPELMAAAAGRYVRRDKTSDFVELKSDGMFSLLQDGKGISGIYNLQGDTVRLTSPSFPPRTHIDARLGGGAIRFTDGNVYEKQAESPKPAGTQLTIDQITQMVGAKIPDDIIIASIEKSGSKFDLSPENLIKLKTAGVSDAVLRAMAK